MSENAIERDPSPEAQYEQIYLRFLGLAERNRSFRDGMVNNIDLTISEHTGEAWEVEYVIDIARTSEETDGAEDGTEPLPRYSFEVVETYREPILQLPEYALAAYEAEGGSRFSLVAAGVDSDIEETEQETLEFQRIIRYCITPHLNTVVRVERHSFFNGDSPLTTLEIDRNVIALAPRPDPLSGVEPDPDFMSAMAALSAELPTGRDAFDEIVAGFNPHTDERVLYAQEINRMLDETGLL